jgi:hypothetical protein
VAEGGSARRVLRRVGDESLAPDESDPSCLAATEKQLYHLNQLC